MNLIYLGSRIKELRELKKITQVKLGELINKNDKYISCIERGINLPSMSAFVKILDILGGSADYVLNNTSNENLSDYMEKLKLLSNDDRQYVLNLIDMLYQRKL